MNEKERIKFELCHIWLFFYTNLLFGCCGFKNILCPLRGRPFDSWGGGGYGFLATLFIFALGLRPTLLGYTRS